MARSHNWTNPQREIGRALSDGKTIKRYGNRGTHSGYAVFDVNGRWLASASKATIKTLAGYRLIAPMGNPNAPLYFTTKGYWSWVGGAPTGDAVEKCAAADAWVAEVEAMIAVNSERAS